jgi:hypothetical protein
MKRIFLGILLTVLVMPAPAQFLQKQDNLSIPFFDIVLADGIRYRVTDMIPGQSAMLVYFDPDCDHCVDFIKKLMKRSGEFKNIQVILVTYVPLNVVKSFVLKTGLDKFPQIKTGTEGEKFIVRYYYNVIQFPYVALHDRNGKLFATFEGEVPEVSELARMF